MTKYGGFRPPVHFKGRQALQELYRMTKSMWRIFPREACVTIIVGYLTGIFTLVVLMYVTSRY